MSDVILVDFDAVFWRFWHVTQNDADPQAGASSTVRSIRALRAMCSHAIVCVDAPRSWRHDVSPAYKSDRKEKTEAGAAQRTNALSMLAASGFAPIQVAGHEADDLIASACKWARGKDMKVLIATMDKDLHQLVDDSVKVLALDTKAVRGPEYVTQRYGIDVRQLGDWLALVGDTSDTIAGVPGVGDKTATALLTRFGDILGILDEARNENGDMAQKRAKLRAALLENQQQLALARKLVTLTDDVAVEWEKHMTTNQGTEGQCMNTVIDGEVVADNDEMGNVVDMPRAADSQPSAAATPAPQAPQPPQQSATVQAMVKRDGKTNDFTVDASIVRAPQDWNRSLEPMNLKDAYAMAVRLSESDMFNATLRTPQAVFAAMCLARAHGVETMKVLMPGMLHNINGKISMSAQMIVGLILKSGKAEYFECIESTNQRAVYVTKRVGGANVQKMEFTIEEAKTAGYLAKPGSSWHKTPKVMLRHRCETELGRMVYPDVVGGLYDPQEFEDAEARPERAA